MKLLNTNAPIETNLTDDRDGWNSRHAIWKHLVVAAGSSGIVRRRNPLSRDESGSSTSFRSITNRPMASEDLHDRLGVWATLAKPGLAVKRDSHLRTTPFRVINASLPRTGTASMQEALSILGYPTYHFANIFASIKDADMWSAAMDGKFFGGRSCSSKHDFDRLLGHVRATCDVPSVLFVEELLACYPDAKVVLVDRDIESWYMSFEGVLEGVMHPFARYFLRYADPTVSGRAIGCCVRWVEALTGSGNLQGAKLGAREAYRTHYRKVRSIVPPERLLEYRLAEGWEPLCRFLDRSVPDSEFPRRNDSECLQAAFKYFVGRRIGRCFVNIGVVIALISIIVGTISRLR